MVKASLKNHRQSARKVRSVVDEIRGKKVNDALVQLSFIPKRASLPIKKLVESAVSNAKVNYDLDPENLIISSIKVNEGVTMKRWIPKWRGIAHPIRKRTSHIEVVLDEVSKSKKEVKKVKKDNKNKDK